MGDDEEIRKINKIRSGYGYSVRQSEETLNVLEKENFNLKLKLFLLENKYGMPNSSKAYMEMSSVCDKDYFEIFAENESLKKDLKEKHEIMKNALDAIEMLEEEKSVQEKKSRALIDEQSRKIDALKSRSKLTKKAKKILANPSDAPKLKEDFKTLRSQNSELFDRINCFKREITSKTNTIEKLTAEKQQIHKELEMTRIKIKNSEKAMLDLRDELSKQIPDNLVTLKSENDVLKRSIAELTEKCQKLEKKAKDFERLIGEQNSLMKALNRTIEAKNEELRDYKIKLDSGDASFSVEKIINLADNDGDTEKSQFPFHNPLFGNFSSKYR